MDAYGEAIHPHYYQSALYTQPGSDLWDEQHSFLGDYSNQIAAPTMERWMQETDRSLFVLRLIDNCGMGYPYLSPEAGPWSQYVPETAHYAYPTLNRCSSASDSGSGSSYVSYDCNDRHSTPMSSPTPSIYCRSPELFDNDIPLPYGRHPLPCLDRCDSGESGVAMHDIQRYADMQPEIEAFEDDDHTAYYAYHGVHEGYQPMQVNGEEDEDIQEWEEPTTNGETHYSDLPNFRHRRTQTTRSVTSSSRTSSKVSKRENKKRRSTNKSKSVNEKSNGHNEISSNRAFPCTFTPYGCPSTFGSKNEWKRHINTQHIRLGFWRCDLCDQAERKSNDFNRKDLFIQHIRRMHPIEKTKVAKTKSGSVKSSRNDPEERALTEAAQRCWRQTRSAPAECGCLFCDVKFHGSGTWDERLEHIGRHMENNKKTGAVDSNDWLNDEAMEEWLVQEKIIVPSGDEYVLAA